MEPVGRLIYWNIPESYKSLMYLLFFVAMAFFAIGMVKKFRFVTAGRKGGIRGLIPEKLNKKAFLETLFFTGRVPRSPGVGIFHALIFYGFVILWIATDLVKIHTDTPFKIFQGWIYITVSFLADIASVAILLGLGVAFYRRYIKRPPYLSATKPKQELFMYAMLFLLVVLGLLLESIRIVATGMPESEMLYSPVGWFGAWKLQFFGLANGGDGGDGHLTGFYRGVWMIHMINTMVFIACIPYTKFLHMFTLPLNALLTPDRRGGILQPMNFEDEEAETFGLAQLSDLTIKNNLDLLSCVECGRCTNACPAFEAGKNLDPKTIITKIRDFKWAKGGKEGKEGDGNLWEPEPLYSADELDACTMCGACMEECPAHIEHVPLIMEAKRYKALTKGEIPPAAADAIHKIKLHGNPWGMAQEDRFQWAEELDETASASSVPVAKPGKTIDYLYYVGCAGSYDSANQKVVRDTVRLLQEARVDFAVMGKTEKCNGDPIRRFGDEYTFQEVALENIAHMNRYSFNKIVTHCPHCLHTIGKEYPKLQKFPFETVHHTELLSDLLKTGKLKASKRVEQRMTFHDPCYLGRHHGSYQAPRNILDAIPGLSTVEMKRSKDRSLCCGMGGGNMWYELPQGEHLAKNRLRDIGVTKAPKLASACSYCMINFNSTKTQVQETEDLEIEDVATVLAKSVF